MPLPGGATDKFGNRYEGRWTVARMADILVERADAIRLEPPGIEGEGVEFWLRKGNIREYHQVKRQYGSEGRWTLAALAGKGVLSHFWEKLRDPSAQCVFVSTHAAFQLDELADRARRAASWEEFRHVFLPSISQVDLFDDLCRRLGCSPSEAVYDALRRIRIDTVGEDVLRAMVESRLAALVEGDPATIVDILAQLALDKVHHELTSHDIWHHLENRGFRRRQWGKDLHVLAAVQAANERYLAPLRQNAVNHRIIPRDEVETVLDMLTCQDERRGVLLVGEAGVGKSGIILQVVETLQERGVPFMALRIDRLEPTPLPDNVGKQIGLLASPAHVLAAIAQGRECVLIIDQLDAVSLASGRHPNFFECIDEMLRQAQAHPQLRVLLACRKFDLDNDHRLRRLTGEGGLATTVTINPLSHDTVRNVVSELGLDVSRLQEKQVRLLSIPLHLSLLADIAADKTFDALNFETVNDLYDRFWKHKQTVLCARLGRVVQWTRVIDILCDYMSERQKLSVPVSHVDDYAKDAEAMASEHVLTRDGLQYAFFHEGFFDYAFARRFAARGHQLLPFLCNGEQHLFRRAQVRQILLHEREIDHAQYLINLRELLTRADIRFHLKEVVFALLRNLTDPTEEEWQVLAPLIEYDPIDPHTRAVWRMLHSVAPWFQLLDSLGLIEAWLASQVEERVNHAVTLLSSVQRKLPDRVAALLEPYIGTSEEWKNRLVYISQWSEPGAGRRFLELFLRLIDEGILDEARGPIAVNSDFWSIVYGMHQTHPDWACEVIGHYFQRRLAISLAVGQSNPFPQTIPDSQLDDEILLESARRAPQAFVMHVLPFMLRVLTLTAQPDESAPWYDPVWEYRWYGKGYSIAHALLSAMETALSALALQEPEAFAITAAPLRSLDFETMQYLLIRAYAANGARFADDAAAYLCERSSRLRTGYVDNAYWATRQLLEAITPHCTDAHLAQLERTILDYYPDHERSTEGRQVRGHAQCVLLEGIAASRRSLAVTRRLAEWQRKFGTQPVEPPQPIQARYVESPIPSSAVEKMTDDQWLRAITQYGQDTTVSEHHRSLRGGAFQLARQLESQVKGEPARFAALVHHFPDTTHPSYFRAVLRGITGTNLDTDTILRVCQRCHRLSGRPCGDEIPRLIAHVAQHPLPEDALALVAWYATEDPDPSEETWRTQRQNSDRSLREAIHIAAINSVRGIAAEVIRDLIFHDGSRLDYFTPTLDKMVQDPSLAVRSSVAATLIAVLRHDRECAIRYFQRLCDTDDLLLATPYVERFVHYAISTHFTALSPLLERMIASDIAEVATVGARQACVAALTLEEAQPLAQRCLSGTDALRIGAAEVCATNLRDAQVRVFCETALIQLFDDPEEEVRAAASACFRSLKGEDIADFVHLVEAFVHSQAFVKHYYSVLYALDKTTVRLPEVTCLLCERFLETVGFEAADIRTTHVANTRQVSQLVVRIHSQSTDPAVQSRCLNIIDEMTRIGVYGLEEALESYNR